MPDIKIPQEEEYDSLDSLLYNPKIRRDLYICNPEKNKMCNKRGCFWNGELPDLHPCFCTGYYEYAVGRQEEMDKLLKDYYWKVVANAKEALEKYGIKNEGHEK